MVNSTAEFERIESHLHALTSPGTSENSQGTDGIRSRHWQQVIREFEEEARKKLVSTLLYCSAATAEFDRTFEPINPFA